MAPRSAPAPARRPSPRVSRRRYWVRRLGVLAVLGVLAYSIARVVTGMFGDDAVADGAPAGTTVLDASVESGADGDAATDNGTDLTADGATEAAGDGTDASSTDAAATTTTTEAERSGPPSADSPAKVYIVGDSDAGTFGPYLERLLDGTGIVDTELNYKVSSGLARPDFFDWPNELRSTLPEVDPDIVVVTFGGNDAQGLSVASGEFIVGDPTSETEAWTDEYQRRVGEVMDLLAEDDRTVVWVGIPNDDNPDVTARMAIQDQAVRAAAAERPDVVFVDTWNRFSGRDGNWAEFVIDPRDGQGKDVRASDGFHLNETGAEILALDIAQAVRDDLRARGAEI